MPLHDLTEFLKLSSSLNYNLSASSINRYNILLFIIGNKRLHTQEEKDRRNKSIVMDAIGYLISAYSHKRRRLGPMAVIHPLRSAALLTSAAESLNLIDLITQFFHDILEDIQSVDFEVREWLEMEKQLAGILERLEPEDEACLEQRLLFLTRLKSESYFQYIGRLLDGASSHPKLVATKLADRLDNTLDMRIGLNDPLEGFNFFENVFQILFVNSYHGFQPEVPFQLPMVLNGAKRLYQLFKNAVLLSLIRQKRAIKDFAAAEVLFEALARASLLESQRIFIKTVGYHYRKIRSQRALLLDAMDYCFNGRTDMVTRPEDGRLLDGLFTTYFGVPETRLRNQRLDDLYQNKPLMIQSSIAFSVIFLSFLNNSEFFVKGISKEGISAGST
jgi:hypothetical protein